MLKSASRSCWEKTSNATIVWVRSMPSMSAKRCVTTCATSSRVAHAQDRDEVPLAGDAVGLGDAFDVGELAPELGDRGALGADQDDGVGHRSVWVSPGSSTSTSLKPAFWTSDLNAWASVSIGGNVP